MCLNCELRKKLPSVYKKVGRFPEMASEHRINTSLKEAGVEVGI